MDDFHASKDLADAPVAENGETGTWCFACDDMANLIFEGKGGRTMGIGGGDERGPRRSCTG